MNKNKRADSQKSGLAGELFVAAELLKRGYQVSVTFGNAKSIDLFAYNEKKEKTFNIQVKTLRKSNAYILNITNVNKAHIYVFVLLNDIGKEVEYYIISGKTIIKKEYDLFGPKGGSSYFAGITMGRIKPYKDKWQEFEK